MATPLCFWHSKESVMMAWMKKGLSRHGLQKNGALALLQASSIAKAIPFGLRLAFITIFRSNASHQQFLEAP